MTTVTQGRVVRSEWIKLATLRSMLVTYGAIASLLVVVAGVMLTLPGADADGDTGEALLTLLVLVEMLVGVTGVVAFTGEYGSATIRSTFAAVPARVPVLLAKVVVYAGSVLALFVPAIVVGALAGATFAPDDMGPLTDGDVLRGLTGSAFVLTVTCILGIALGALTRSAPAGIGIVFALMFFPVVITFAPSLTAFVPGRAGQAVVLSDDPPEAQLLDPWTAVAVLVVWAVLAVAAAAIAMRRRDA